MTRDEILAALRNEHANLLNAMAGISDDRMATLPIVDKWTLKDLMGHVAMWEQVAIKFIAEFKQDGLPRSVGIKDDAALNAHNERGWTLRRDWPLARIRAELDAAFRDLVAAVETLSDAQLRAQLPAPWKEGTTLERLIAINSYEHEPEHTAQIQKWRAGGESRRSPYRARYA